MDIKYIQINDTDVKAIVTYNTAYPDRINEDIVNVLLRFGKLTKKDVEVSHKFSAVAHAPSKEEFDFETGKCVARDKVLIKYYSQVNKAYENYINALEEYLDDIQYMKYKTETKIDNAYNRYIKY